MSEDFMRVDPRRQREFINELNTRVRNIENVINIFESRLRLLGQSWRDPEYEAFVKQARSTVQILEKFIQEGKRVAIQLDQSASYAETYLKIKL